MPRLVRQLVTLLLCISLMPGWVEVLENVEHLLHDGHLAHHGDHAADVHADSHDALAAEHGCTAMAHLCPCHSSMPAVLRAEHDPVTRTARATRDVRPLGARDDPVQRANAPPVPPPRA